MRAVDTNVIVRLMVRDDPQQVAAAERYVAAGVWVSVLAIAEATWVLGTVYERDAAHVVDVVEKLLNHKDVTIQDSDVVAAALELFKARPSLGFSDCLLLEIARKAGHLPLGTFDRNLAKLDGAERL